MDQNFTRSVLSWYDAGHRDLPWRRTKDAYRIWISEIMLQQTRAETVVSYYERFLARYPDVRALADAPEEELLKAWEGLGYYSRARLLQKAAREIVSQYGGELPADLQKLRALPGVGGLHQRRDCIHCVRHSRRRGGWQRRGARDLSVFRDFRGDGSPKSRRMIHELAQSSCRPTAPAARLPNAMMEMGATMCTPKSPSCLLCPVRAGCKGYAQGMAERLPVCQAQEKSAAREALRDAGVLPKPLMLRRSRLSAAFRPGRGRVLSPAQIARRKAYDACAGCAKHVFTHLIWEMEIHAFVADALTDVPDGRWVNADELAALPMPTAVKAARKFAGGGAESMKRAARGIWLMGDAAGGLSDWRSGLARQMEMRFPQFYLGAAAFLLVRRSGSMESQTRLCKAAAIFSAVAGMLVGLFVGLTALFSNFGHTEVLKTLASPSETFEARVIDVDQGALGGNTLVDVRDCRFSLDMDSRQGRRIAAFIPGRGAKGRK